MAARSHDDQIGSFLIRNLRDHMCCASHPHPGYPERHVEAFLLQPIDTFPKCGLDLVFVEIDRIPSTPADRELIYVHDDQPSVVSLREAPGERALEPSVAQIITLNIITPLSGRILLKPTPCACGRTTL